MDRAGAASVFVVVWLAEPVLCLRLAATADRCSCLLPFATLSCMARYTISYFRQLVRKLEYVVSSHAAEELEDDGLSILDLESIILSGHVLEHQ